MSKSFLNEQRIAHILYTYWEILTKKLCRKFLDKGANDVFHTWKKKRPIRSHRSVWVSRQNSCILALPACSASASQTFSEKSFSLRVFLVNNWNKWKHLRHWSGMVSCIDSFHSCVIRLQSQKIAVLRILIYTRLKINEKWIFVQVSSPEAWFISKIQQFELPSFHIAWHQNRNAVSLKKVSPLDFQQFNHFK